MSSAILPTRSGGSDNSLTKFVVPESVSKTPLYRSVVQSADSSAEYRAQRGTLRHLYGLELNALDATARDTLYNFFVARGGRWDSFQYEDPWTGSLVQVRFDQDELEFTPLLGSHWHVSISMIQVV